MDKTGRVLRFLVVFALVALPVGPASAVLVTDTSGFGSSLVVNFSQYAGCTNFASPGCAAPLDVGGLVGRTVNFTGTSPVASVFNGGFGLGSNGSWNSGRNGYAGLNNGDGFLRFTFADGPVSAVGAFMNYTPGLGGDPMIQALDAGGNLLEGYNLAFLAPISTPGATDDGAFRGFVHGSADIAAIQFLNSFTVVDNLTFSPVPEPATLLLVSTTAAGLGLARWRQRRRIKQEL